MRVLIGHERSGIVRAAFRAAGHDAYSCDIEPAEDASPFHIQADIMTQLAAGWDLAIFHPDCTYLTVSGLHWNKRTSARYPIPGQRAALTEQALDHVRALLAAPIPRIALENPIGCISSRIRKPDQIIQPYMFGHDASKATCLWLVNLPPLDLPHEEHWIAPRIINGRPRWGNQTDSGQNKLGPSPTRAMDRARTYEGIAAAFVANWGTLTSSPRR